MKGNNFFKSKMAEEISKRAESAEWNSIIASEVLSRRRNKQKKIFLSVSASSLAAAAAVAFVLTGVLNNKNEGMIYDEFITAQIKGTYESSLPAKNKPAAKKIQGDSKKNEIAAGKNQSNDDIVTEDIDTLITETLALR
jgi:hypothetical protein